MTKQGYGPDHRARRAALFSIQLNCQMCGKPGRSDDHADHKRPIRQGGAAADLDNYQRLCHSCHSRKTADEDGGWGNKLKHSSPAVLTLGAGIAESAERELSPVLGLVAVKQALSAAELIMAGAGRWKTQAIRTPTGDIYMRRHFLTAWRQRPQVWVHEILLPDADPFCHDHPWDYRTVLLTGAYDEETPTGMASYEQAASLERDAESLHRLHLVAPVVTLFVTGQQRREWGFQTDDGWLSAADYWSTRVGRDMPARVA